MLTILASRAPRQESLAGCMSMNTVSAILTGPLPILQALLELR